MAIAFPTYRLDLAKDDLAENAIDNRGVLSRGTEAEEAG